ncbi:YtzH-like family protein [Evansella sp. LMS18]|uniref:YtzH-like family protein n=1 Tax=Evansella sp. LMS18 TaxID=2924033 RepID=UPI0020D01BED|nr:YtzH-like family protein [Evansella sp. LMS18]UTR11437.1 YtzH-like family protein [Evansella sp. LMS18]
MTMNYHHQLQLLSDILMNQHDEHYGTHDEYQQVERLANALLQNPSVNGELRETLNTIRNFAAEHDIDGQQGNFIPSELSSWVNQIQNSNQNGPGMGNTGNLNM